MTVVNLSNHLLTYLLYKLGAGGGKGRLMSKKACKSMVFRAYQFGSTLWHTDGSFSPCRTQKKKM